MRLTNKQINDYQKMYFDAFGKSISKDDALVQALALVRLVAVLAKPTNEERINDRASRTTK